MKKMFNYSYTAEELMSCSDYPFSVYSFNHNRDIMNSLSDEEYAIQGQYNNSYVATYFRHFDKIKLTLECFSVRGIK